jgi:GntR family transcriptional repressor for pyruvate dehydrogenase complex
MMAFLNRTSIADDALSRIVEMIRSQPFAPGDRLPGERLLAEKLACSRTSVRAALGRLVTIGVLDSQPGRGTYVKEPRGEVFQAALAPHLAPNADTLRMLFELREIIEVEAAGRAAERATPEQVAGLRRTVDLIDRCIDRRNQDGLVQADVDFHRQIVMATGNAMLVDLVDHVVPFLREMRYASTATLERFPGQRAVLRAIEARHPQAARQAMRAHLVQVHAKAELSMRRQIGDQARGKTGNARRKAARNRREA